ncbi:hypothetical protein GCM10023339_46660 [Alloalcanivorax gelatiniphagus]
MRCVKRRLSDIVFHTMLNDAARTIQPARTTTRTGPGGQRGNGATGQRGNGATRQRGNGATGMTPARPAHSPTPTLRTSHFPDPPPLILEPTAGCFLTQRGARSGCETDAMSTARTSRFQCCVCGDPATLDATDYVELAIQAPESQTPQWLGAHRACLNQVFEIEVMVGD